MEAQVLSALGAITSGASPVDALDVLHQLVTDDPMALAVLVGAGGLTTMVQNHEQRVEAVATIIVCASEEYAHEVVRADALPLLLQLTSVAQHEEDATWALGNLSAHADITEAMLSLGTLATCIRTVTSSQCALSRCFAASTLANLVVDERGKREAGEMGGVEAMLDVLPYCEVDAAAQVTRCLANLLLDGGNRLRVVAHAQGLHLLLQQLALPDEALQESAARALANIAFDAEHAKAVCATGGVGSVVELLQSNSSRVHMQALCALRNLTADALAAQSAVQGGAIAPLVQLLSSDAAAVQAQTAWVIGSLSSTLQDSVNMQLVQAGVLPKLKALKYSSSAECRQAATHAMGNLAQVLTPNSRRVIEQGTVQLDRTGRPAGRRSSSRPSPLGDANNARSVWRSPLGGAEVSDGSAQ